MRRREGGREGRGSQHRREGRREGRQRREWWGNARCGTTQNGGGTRQEYKHGPTKERERGEKGNLGAARKNVKQSFEGSLPTNEGEVRAVARTGGREGDASVIQADTPGCARAARCRGNSEETRRVEADTRFTVGRGGEG